MRDIFCFSHLRWDFVYQRPQHLLSRFSARQRVFYIEEPVFDAPLDYYNIRKIENINVWIITPHLPPDLTPAEKISHQRIMIDNILSVSDSAEYITWYYTPMALPFTDHLNPAAVVFDCMDELSGFKFAPPELIELENRLIRKADVMFTGGNSLFQIKKAKHRNIFSLPSSVDKDHFMAARKNPPEPEDQHGIGHPRLGFFGVIDERFDQELIREVARRRPDFHFILVGPIVKIDPEELPRANNIHYLGSKAYADLPHYLAGWDIAILPFARNASTKYISPTKTPEYLCGGKPVISTSIHDVVYPYGKNGLARIADTAEDFVQAADELMTMSPEVRRQWLKEVDRFLADISWDNTYETMAAEIRECLKINVDNKKLHPYV